MTSKAEQNGHIALTAEQILGADDLPREWVATPDWAPKGTNPELCGVFVRTMTGADRDSWELSCLDKNHKVRKLSNIRARLCSHTMISKAGKRLFTDSQAAQLGEKSAPMLDLVFDASQKLNALSKADVDELSGNSDGTDDGD